MRRRPLLLIVPIAALAAWGPACDERPGEPAGAPGGHPLAQKLQGRWSVRPAPEALEKMRADLRKAARGDEKKLEEMLGRHEASLSRTSLELTGDTMITREAEREIAAERYEVVAATGDAITIRSRAGREQRFVFQDDDTLSAELGDLGKVVLTRR